MKVTTAEFIKGYGRLADQALSEPVVITKNGRDRLVLISVDEYERLILRDRRVYRAGEVPEDIADAIANAEPPPESKAVERKLKRKTR